MTIIAFSLGTQVAFEITKISPKQVKRLLLSGAACGKLTPKLALTLEASIASVSQDFNLYLTDVFPKYLAQNGLNYKETKSTFIAMAKSLGKDVCIRQLQAVLATTITKQDLTKINCPTLIIAGDLDRRTPPDVQQELKRTIPNAKLAMIKGAEHFVTLQAPNVINNLMASWLGDILNEHANSTL
jgi:pimeloyl-ACP methyl ester carboxylesterase